MGTLRSRYPGDGTLVFYDADTGDDILKIDAANVAIDVVSGAKFKIAGVDVTSGQSANGVAGLDSGYKLARGTGTLGGSNPTTIVTGLSTIVSFVAQLKNNSAPGLGTSVLTTHANATPGSEDVYAWKPTSVSNPTLIASTGTETFDWIAIGT